jgi:hypothetical protein
MQPSLGCRAAKSIYTGLQLLSFKRAITHPLCSW